MSLLVDDLLLLARLDEGRPLDREPVELDARRRRGRRHRAGGRPALADRARGASRPSSPATATGSGSSSTTCSRTSARTRRPGRLSTSGSHATDDRAVLDGRRRRPRPDRRRGRARLRALLPRRRVALARERRRRARPLDRGRRRRGARRDGRRAGDARRRRDLRDRDPLGPQDEPRTARRHDHPDQRGSKNMTEHEITRRRLLELGLALPPLAALAAAPTRRRGAARADAGDRRRRRPDAGADRGPVLQRRARRCGARSSRPARAARASRSPAAC